MLHWQASQTVDKNYLVEILEYNLMCEIVIRMIDKKKMLNKLANRFIRIWRHISHKDLQRKK